MFNMRKSHLALILLGPAVHGVHHTQDHIVFSGETTAAARGKDGVRRTGHGLCLQGRRVPQLFLLGAQKCATSSLAEDLMHMGVDAATQHNDKETHFFDTWTGPDDPSAQSDMAVERADWLQSLPNCTQASYVLAHEGKWCDSETGLVSADLAYTASVCQDRCTSTEDCSYISFNVKNGWCALFSDCSNPVETNSDHIIYAKTKLPGGTYQLFNEGQWCERPAKIWGERNHTLHSCQQACSANAGCRYLNFDRTNGWCSTLSGCSEPTPTAPHHVTYMKLASSEDGLNFEDDVMFDGEDCECMVKSPHDPFHRFQDGLRSPLQCANLCQQYATRFFSLRKSDGRCWCKTSDKGRSPMSGVISGRRGVLEPMLRPLADFTPSNLRSVPLPAGTKPTGSHWGLWFLSHGEQDQHDSGHAMNLPARLRGMYGDAWRSLFFVIMLRQPLDRMQSTWYHASQPYSNWVQCRDCKANSFREALAGTMERARNHTYDDWLWASMYARHIEAWLKHFEARQMYIIPMKQYVKGARVHICNDMSKRLSFPLDCQVLEGQVVSHSNTHEHVRVEDDAPEELRAEFATFMQAENSRLARLISEARAGGAGLAGYKGDGTEADVGDRKSVV